MYAAKGIEVMSQPAPHQVQVEVGGRPLTFETGKLAKQANGAVLVKYGDTQLLVTACMDSHTNDRDVIAVTGASAAAFISDLPFAKPIAAVRVGLLEGKFVANPTTAEQKKSLLNIVVTGSEEAIVMIEAGGLEVSEDTIADALSFGHDQIKRIIAAIRQLHDLVRPKKVVVPPLEFNEEVSRDIEKRFGERLHDALNTEKHPKKESYRLVDELKQEVLASIPEDDE